MKSPGLTNATELRSANLVKLFPVPLLIQHWPDSEELNQRLKQIILVKERAEVGVSATNVGGWHSRRDLTEWGEECVEILLARIQAMAREMVRRCFGISDSKYLNNWTIKAWANVNRKGCFNKFHNHVEYPQGKHSERPTGNFSLWSGVYYVDNGQNSASAASGNIVFSDEHSVSIKDQYTTVNRYEVKPKPGLMLLFPSSLGHLVEPHNTDGTRISVSFNLSHVEFTTINYEAEKKRNS